MKAFIYTGGEIFPEYITEHPKDGDLCIAADSGWDNAEKTGDRSRVSLLVGDMDSVRSEYREFVNGSGKHLEIIKVPSEKNLTDTQIAVETAIERGADEIIIIGGIGGRLDHTMSNISILEDMFFRHIHATLVNGQSRVRYIRSTSHLVGRSVSYRYLSVIAADECVKGVSIEGCKYPLKNHKLERRLQFAVSNELVGNCALISVKKGGIYIIESRDLL